MYSQLRDYLLRIPHTDISIHSYIPYNLLSLATPRNNLANIGKVGSIHNKQKKFTFSNFEMIAHFFSRANTLSSIMTLHGLWMWFLSKLPHLSMQLALLVSQQLKSECSLHSDESISPHAEHEQVVLGESAVISLLRSWRHKLPCESTTVGRCEHFSAVGETQHETPVLMKSFSIDSHL